MKLFKSLAVALFLPISLFAQYQGETWDKTFRESGKIYVVVAVLSLILLVVLGYLFTQDRRISKIEKELNNKAK